MTSTMQWHHVCLTSFTLVEQFQFVTIDLYIQGRFFIFYEEGLGDSSFQPVGIVFGENGEFRRWRRSEVICFKILNGHHQDIQFTHEIEENGKIPFLDVDMQRSENNKLRLNVYRKKTCSNIYIHWKSFAPTSWKIGTLEGMIRRPYVICTEDDDLKTELSFITHIFHTINGYPQRIIERSQEKNESKACYNNTNSHNR